MADVQNFKGGDVQQRETVEGATLADKRIIKKEVKKSVKRVLVLVFSKLSAILRLVGSRARATIQTAGFP